MGLGCSSMIMIHAIRGPWQEKDRFSASPLDECFVHEGNFECFCSNRFQDCAICDGLHHAAFTTTTRAREQITCTIAAIGAQLIVYSILTGIVRPYSRIPASTLIRS